ncbi:MAG: hypothetical protein IJS61_08720 [Firmicutes bacterium]|nr:hypothetical protein [Bacillota bacterium]
MKKEYTTPVVTVTALSNEDIITVSGIKTTTQKGDYKSVRFSDLNLNS